MKLTVFFLVLGLTAASAKGFGQRITIHKNNVSIEKILNLIEKQTDYQFFFKQDELILEEKINADFNGATIEQVLEKCLYGKPLSYTIIDKTIVLRKKIANDVIPQKSTNVLVDIQGKVIDSKGLPIPGVSVKVKGSNGGVVTDNEGKYSLKLENGNAILVFSSIGYNTLEVAVNNRKQLDVTLQEQVEQLGNVIVVGYGTQKKSDVTGSISSVKEEALKAVPAGNVLSALQGQVAGVDIERSSGSSKPGSVPEIRIRGSRSITGSNDPLYVVDGIPFNGNLSNLNQDDITSLQILKDASATAIYGSRGANGVVLITTRRGKPGKAVVNYNGYVGAVKPVGQYDIMNAEQFSTFKKWSRVNGSFTTVNGASVPYYTGIDDPKFLSSSDAAFQAEEKAGLAAGTSTNWQDLIYRTGIQTNHEISLSGGSENTQFAVSGGYYNETGIYEGQGFERFSLKFSLDQQFGKRFRVGINSLNNVSTITGENANPLGQALRASPLVGPYDANGVLYGFLPGSNSQVWNPFANLVPGKVAESRKRSGTFTTVYGEADLLPGLKYRFNGGAEIRPESYGNFRASATYYNLGGASTARNESSNFYNYTLENLLIYDKVFKEKHHLNFTGLYSLQEQRAYSNGFSYNNILSDAIQYYNPSYGSNLTGSGSEAKFDIISYMGRLNYDYDGKYLLTLTMRSDGSSVLAPGNKYHVFPSAALGWNIDREKFMSNLAFISSLKLRASYGSVGNAAVSPYNTLGGLSTIPYNYGSANTTGVYPTDVPNPNLTWEFTKSTNLGVDFGILKDRITGSVDVYKQSTHNLLLDTSLPSTSGIQNKTVQNVGQTENKGLEISLSSINIQGSNGGFTWSTNLNASFNRNKIISLANGVTSDISNNRFVGYAINPIFNYQRIGIWQNTPEDIALATSYGLTLNGSGSVIGTIKVADINGDGKINSDDRIILGATAPRFTGGLTNKFTYKGFDMVVVSTFKVGGLLQANMYQGGSFIASFQGNYNNINVNYWTPFNNENYYPKPNSAQTSPNYADLLGYVDASYFKIKTLSLGYSLPESISKKIGTKNLRVYANAFNQIILFSPFKNKFGGLDPETRNNISVDTPPVKSWLFGINASF